MSAAAVSRRAVVVLAVAAAVVLLGASAAQAHNTLVSTDPVDGSTVAAAPARVTLTLNEPARSLGTEVVVTAPDGTTVSAGEPVLDGATVSQGVAGSLPAGAYTITWRVTSADGHPIEGVLSFTATGAATVGGHPAAAVSPTPIPTLASTPTPTLSTAALSGAASIGPVAPATGAEIAPLVTDQHADGGDGSISAVVVAGFAALVVVLVVVGAVLLLRRRAHVPRSRSTRV